MKRQEICEKTGLTPKALRLYEEKGLIAPDKSGIHHKMRDYSQEDLDRLLIIATLRKAMFTMAEIKEMLDAPETIQEIFPQYLSWLREQRKQISDLLAASEQVDLASIRSAQDLTDQIQGAARNLPIPASDIHFRFRQLDKLDVRPEVLPPDERLLVFDEKPVLWPYLKSYSRKWTDETVIVANEQDTSVRDREPGRDPVGLAIIKGVLMAISVCLGIVCLIHLFVWSFPWKLWVAFLIVAALRGGLEYLKYQKERQTWLDRIRKEQDET